MSIRSGVTPTPTQLSLTSFTSLMTHDSLFELYELISMPEAVELEPPSLQITFLENLPAAVTAVLTNHSAVFQLPTGLPPVRQFDHRIHLLPNSN